MNLEDFKEYTKKFICYLSTEKQVAYFTVRSYASDISQLHTFWYDYEKKYQKTFVLSELLPQYEKWLFSGKLSGNSIARKCSCLASLHRFFIKQGMHENLLIERPFLTQKTPFSVHIHKLMNLFDVIQDEQLATKYPSRDRALIELLYATGMRCSELASLRIEDIDFEEKVIRVHGSKERLVLFGSKAYEKLMLYLQHERGSYKSNEALFISYRKSSLTSRSIQRICLMFSEVLGEKKKITPMVFRNSFATHLLAKGADSSIVKELLGYTTTISIEKYMRKKIVKNL